MKAEADAAALAALLGQRYTTMRQRVKIAVGMDTYGMELLDTVRMDMTVNDRKFSVAEHFIKKALDNSGFLYDT